MNKRQKKKRLKNLDSTIVCRFQNGSRVFFITYGQLRKEEDEIRSWFNCSSL